MFKEETICKLQQGKTKLHLLKLTTYNDNTITEDTKYQIRLNRKHIKTSKNEYDMWKIFARIAVDIITQLKLNL